MLYLCLIEPEIPQNTGNIGRTCAATGSVLVLVHPLGFDISDKAARRSGLDYWKDVKKIEFQSQKEFLDNLEGKEAWFFSAHGERSFSSVSFPKEKDIYLVFGKESCGLGEEILSSYKDRTLRIPMKEDKRCLNLSNAVAVAAYECLRQWDYPDFI